MIQTRSPCQDPILMTSKRNTSYPIFTPLPFSQRIITLKEYNWDLVSMVTDKFTLPSSLIHKQIEQGFQLSPENVDCVLV